MSDGYFTFSELAKKLRVGSIAGMATRLDLEPEAAVELAEILEGYEEEIRKNMLAAVEEFDRTIRELDSDS